MELLVDGSSLPIAQMGPDFLLLGRSIDHPPGTARIVMRIDESESDWEVSLPEGITANVFRVAIALRNEL